jgi:hypothetical protein
MILHSYPVSKSRLILLGASNLTLSLRLIIDLMQQQIGASSEILAAVGHGRAYGVFSQVVWRGLPGIAECGLWRQLNAMESRPTYALLTDIGNDIVYELTPEQVLRAVERCIDRLQRQSAQIVVTNLPIASVERLSERRYTFFRNLFYPFCKLSRDETLSRVRAVHVGLVDMAVRRQFLLVEQEAHWFGSDGIHVNYWQREAFYRDIVRRFPDSGAKPEHWDDKRKFFLTWQRRPVFAFKTVLGRAIHCPQPSGQLADGSPVSKY